MALICNAYRFGHMPHKCLGSVTTIYNGKGFRDISLTGRNRNITAGEGITSDKVGIPMGYLHPKSWVMPQKAGNLSSHNEARGLAAATLLLVSGRNISGAAAGLAAAVATAKLVVSMAGLAEGTSEADATIAGVLLMAGLAEGTSTAAAQKNAIAWCAGTAAGLSTAAMASYAVGYLSGAIYVNEGTASMEQMAAAVWSAVATLNNEPGSMGEKVNDSGSASNPWSEALPGSYIEGQAGYILGNIASDGFLGPSVWRFNIDDENGINAMRMMLDFYRNTASAGEIADAVWNEIPDGHVGDDNTCGYYLLNASGTASVISTNIGNPISLDGGAPSITGMLIKMADGADGSYFTSENNLQQIAQDAANADFLIVDMAETGVWVSDEAAASIADSVRLKLKDAPALPDGAVVADGANSETSFKTSLASTEDDYLKDAFIVFLSGDCADQVKKITGYVGTSKVVTVSGGFTQAPDPDDVFYIINR